MVKEQNELDSLIETFKLWSREESTNNNVNNSFDENKKLDRLIIIDGVSGVADVSKKTSKNYVSILNIFVFISQTNIFNIFLASVPHNTVAKIIQSNCILQSKKYVPARSLWLNRVFTDLANSHEKHCLTIDCGYINKNGPGRYRLTILKNRSAILISQMTTFFIILS